MVNQEQETLKKPPILEDREKEKIFLKKLKIGFHTKINLMLRGSFDLDDEVEKSQKKGKNYTCISNDKLEAFADTIVNVCESLTEEYNTLTTYFDWCSINGAVRNELLAQRMVKEVREKLDQTIKKNGA